MTWGRWVGGRRLAVVFALLLATTGPAAVVAADFGGVVRDQSPANQSPTNQSASNNSTADNTTGPPIVHRNPSEVRNGSDASGVEAWLESEMAQRLSESVNVSQADRQRARQLLDNDSEYAQLAEQYAEVSGENATGSDLADATRFSVIGAIQREFFADVQRYRTTLRRYRNATERDQTLRERRLAHRLERRATEVNRTATRLNRSYANLSAAEQDRLSNVTRAIGEIRANVTQTQLTVRNRTLVRTRLSVRGVEPNGSFADPAVLAGRLRTADGSPVADENVTLRIGNATVNATTDRQGRFRIRYRPVLAPAGMHSQTVEFRPSNESVYFRDAATVRLRIDQTTPRIHITDRTRTVRYNRTVAVAGTVGAGGVGASGVPVAVSVGGVRLGHVETGPNGSFRVERRLPANVSAGRQQVRVRLALGNATRRAGGPVALAPTNASAGVTVESTPTALSIAEVETVNGTAFVSGRLTTASGEPLGNRTIRVSVNGTPAARATTNATGGYAVTVPIPSRLRDGGSAVRIEAAHSSRGNLDASRATATAALSSPDATASDRYLWLGAAGAAVVAMVGAFVWRVRSDDEPALDADATDDALAETPVVAERSPDELLGEARSALADDRFDAAVSAAYLAVRSRFREDLASATPMTHLEFYRACRDADLPAERLRRLDRLTRAYETAAFSTESTDESDAAEAVETAEALAGEPLSDDHGAGEKPA